MLYTALPIRNLRTPASAKQKGIIIKCLAYIRARHKNIKQTRWMGGGGGYDVNLFFLS